MHLNGIINNELIAIMPFGSNLQCFFLKLPRLHHEVNLVYIDLLQPHLKHNHIHL